MTYYKTEIRLKKLFRSLIVTPFKKIVTVVQNAGFDGDSVNLLRNRQRIASMESASYIEEKLPMAIPFRFKLDFLKNAVAAVKLNGMYCEFGVFKGESINFIAKNIRENIVYGFDSYDGLPEDWKYDMRKGTFKVTKPPRVKENVKLITGLFENTLPDFLNSNKSILAFLHIDCDLYSSTKTVFDNLHERIVPGTVIVFDEYFNYPGWEEGEFKAFKEFIEMTGKRYRYIGYCYLGRQVSVLME